MDRAVIRRTDYPAMGGNQLVPESQAHKWYRQALTDNGCCAKEEEEEEEEEEEIYDNHQKYNCVFTLWQAEQFRAHSTSRGNHLTHFLNLLRYVLHFEVITYKNYPLLQLFREHYTASIQSSSSKS